MGPRPFEMGEKLYGRDREIRELFYLLSSERVVLLYSPSGAGKSSLVQAGLIPRLRERFDVWRPTRVSEHPPEGVVAGFNRYVLSAIQGFEEGIPKAHRRPAEELARMTFREYVSTRPKRPSAPESIVLIFDQFEEIVTVDPAAESTRIRFFEQLGEVLASPNVWALFILREDFLARLDPYAPYVRTRFNNRFRIAFLEREAALEAISEPARESDRAFSEEAKERLFSDLAARKVQQLDGSFREEAGEDVEPVHLQVVCWRLWDRLAPRGDGDKIDLEDVESLGDVSVALAEYYETCVQSIAREHAPDDPDRALTLERRLREWCGESLITPGEFRGQVLRGEGESAGLDEALIQDLVTRHLVRAEKRRGATWYELAHDRLIAPVLSNNAAWSDANLSRLQKRVRLWDSAGRTEALLFSGSDLAEAESWAARNSLNAVESKFLEEARKAEERDRAQRETAEKERRQSRMIFRLLVGTVVLAVVAVIALYSSRLASERSERDSWSRRLVEASTTSEFLVKAYENVGRIVVKNRAAIWDNDSNTASTGEAAAAFKELWRWFGGKRTTIEERLKFLENQELPEDIDHDTGTWTPERWKEELRLFAGSDGSSRQLSTLSWIESILALDPGADVALRQAREGRWDSAREFVIGKSGRHYGSWSDVPQVVVELFDGESREGLRRQLDPLGVDGNSELYEFLHLPTQAVLVLLPGGKAARRREEARWNHSPAAPRKWRVDFPRDDYVEVPPLFVSKYEITETQWLVWCSDDLNSGTATRARVGAERFAVRRVSWEDCRRFCRTAGLQLPCSVEWTYACFAREPGGNRFELDSEEVLGRRAYYKLTRVDQFGRFAPVGRAGAKKEANSFGLWDMQGNVAEWCHDQFDEPAKQLIRGGSGLSWEAEHVQWWSQLLESGSAESADVGFRPVLRIEAKGCSIASCPASGAAQVRDE